MGVNKKPRHLQIETNIISNVYDLLIVYMCKETALLWTSTPTENKVLYTYGLRPIARWIVRLLKSIMFGKEIKCLD